MKSLSNFERLVLGCIDSCDSDQRLILLDFSRSTKFADFSNRYFCEIFEIAAVQKYENLVDLEKSCKMSILLLS